MADPAHLKRLERDLVDKGRLIEAGWVGFRIVTMDPRTPAAQLQEMRSTFFAGAQFLFSSIMSVLEPGEDPTDKDLARMDSIQKELDEFIQVFELTHTLAKGSA